MSAKILRIVSILTALLALSSPAFASGASEAVNNFAFNAGKIIMSNTKGDFFFSPYSIISAFGMAYAGTSGDTAREIESSLGLTKDIHASLGDLMTGLDSGGYVSSANRVWLKSGLCLKKTYTDTLSLCYNSDAYELDMKGMTEESRREINDWVSLKTNGKINGLLSELDPETRMIITNAVYFNAKWQSKFKKSATRKQKFYNAEGSKVVDMMCQRDDFQYCEVDGVKVIMLPYEGYRLSMIAVLPPKGKPEVLKKVDAETFSEWLDNMEEYEVDLRLPKFKTEKKYEMKKIFETLGVREAFTNEADFSGMTDDEPLKADSVIHQTFIDVDEERTEAAASTAIGMVGATSVPMRKLFAEFHADRPFMYFIRDNETGTILFMGYQAFME